MQYGQKKFLLKTYNTVFRLTKGGGRLVHESVGDAILTLNKKLKVSNIILRGKSVRYKLRVSDYAHFFIYCRVN